MQNCLSTCFFSLMPLGTSFSLQLEKEAKEPRLSGICCKSTFYPLSALQDVLMEV